MVEEEYMALDGVQRFPQLFDRVIIYHYPCEKMEDTMAPSEVEATLVIGGAKVYVLAPITKVDTAKKTIEVGLFGHYDDWYLIDLPDGSATQVKQSEFNEVTSSAPVKTVNSQRD
jgi:hypothetical protein